MGVSVEDIFEVFPGSKLVIEGRKLDRNDVIKESRELRKEEIACTSCQRRLKQATGLLRCRPKQKAITRCSRYVGPHKRFWFELAWGDLYYETIHQARKG